MLLFEMDADPREGPFTATQPKLLEAEQSHRVLFQLPGFSVFTRARKVRYPCTQCVDIRVRLLWRATATDWSGRWRWIRVFKVTR